MLRTFALIFSALIQAPGFCPGIGSTVAVTTVAVPGDPLRLPERSRRLLAHADGTRVARFTSINKPDPYINLENKVTGGNLHVRW